MELIKIKIPKIVEQRKSAEIVASIDDLLTEILLCLPVKSLIEFKFVSKKWHSIITNPNFCLLRNRKTNPAIGLFLRSMNFRLKRSFHYIPFSAQRPFVFAREFSDIDIVQSSNGLLLCRSYVVRLHTEPRYFVCYPTTKQCSKIPNLDKRTRRYIHGMSLAFDPAKSIDFKIICVHESQKNWSLFRSRSDLQFQIQIYSSQTGHWRICGDPFTSLIDFTHSVYWNDSIHWIGNRLVESLYFNVDRQVFGKMPMPPIPDDMMTSDGYFGESYDHLHLIASCQSGIRFNVYEMKRDYSEWFVKYKVDISPILAAYPEMIRGYDNHNLYLFSVLSLVRGEEDEESFLILHIPRKVVRYNIVSMTFEKLHEFKGGEGMYDIQQDAENEVLRSWNGFQYIESLLCV